MIILSTTPLLSHKLSQAICVSLCSSHSQLLANGHRFTLSYALCYHELFAVLITLFLLGIITFSTHSALTTFLLTSCYVRATSNIAQVMNNPYCTSQPTLCCPASTAYSMRDVFAVQLFIQYVQN
jgi:hypothetical protein